MAHNLDFTTGQAGLAFRGNRADIWHRLGQQHQDGWTIDDWAKQAGLAWDAVKVPALADLSSLPMLIDTRGALRNGSELDKVIRVENRHFIARGDNGHILSPGTVTDTYKIVQPREALDFCEQYAGVDDRFQIDTAMCLKRGELIAVTAVFNGDTDVAGSKHKARLLMTTSFDGSGATICKGLMTRVVCNNTLNAGLAEPKTPVISVRHNTKFDKDKVGGQLAQIAHSFASYKAMGEAMACHTMTPEDLSRFFKLTLDIDPKVKQDEISTRKQNQFAELVNCYKAGTRQEGLEPNTAWSALQAVTRYADHNRTVKGTDGTAHGVQEGRFYSANFGSGAQMKAQAVAYLDEMSSGDLLRAVAAVTPSKAQRDDSSDFAAFMAQPFKPSRG